MLRYKKEAFKVDGMVFSIFLNTVTTGGNSFRLSVAPLEIQLTLNGKNLLQEELIPVFKN